MITKVNGTINFEGSAKFAKNDKESICSYLTFNSWKKNGKERIYINDYKRRTIGYIDVITGSVIINDNQGNYDSEIEAAIEGFIAEYVESEAEETEEATSEKENTMEVTLVNGKLAFKLNGTTIITDGDAEFEYRSHINRNKCLTPENWIALHGKDKEGNCYTVWYYTDKEIVEGYEISDYIDLENPNDIVDEDNHIIYENS